MNLKYPFSNPAIPYAALQMLNTMHDRIEVLENAPQSDAAPENSPAPIDSAFFAGTVNADVILADFAIGKSFHFQAEASGINLTSSQVFVTNIDGFASFGASSPLAIPGGTQGFISKSLSGNVAVTYKT